jgi:hypothetical protein
LELPLIQGFQGNRSTDWGIGHPRESAPAGFGADG